MKVLLYSVTVSQNMSERYSCFVEWLQGSDESSRFSNDGPDGLKCIRISCENKAVPENHT